MAFIYFTFEENAGKDEQGSRLAVHFQYVRIHRMLVPAANYVLFTLYQSAKQKRPTKARRTRTAHPSLQPASHNGPRRVIVVVFNEERGQKTKGE